MIPTGGAVKVLCGLFVALFVGLLLIGPHWDDIGINLGPSCAVGVSGSAAVVSVHGWDASAACAAMTHANTYTYSGPTPSQPIVCQYTISGERYTVQDDGLLKAVGASVCANLQKEQQ